MHLKTKQRHWYVLNQSEQVSFSWNSSDLHFSLGLGLSLVCETRGECFKHVRERLVNMLWLAPAGWCYNCIFQEQRTDGHSKAAVHSDEITRCMLRLQQYSNATALFLQAGYHSPHVTVQNSPGHMLNCLWMQFNATACEIMLHERFPQKYTLLLFHEWRLLSFL